MNQKRKSKKYKEEKNTFKMKRIDVITQTT